MYILYSNGSIEANNMPKSISQSEYEKGYYYDFIKVPVMEEKEVDDSIYRTNEKGEKELVLERTKTISAPILDNNGEAQYKTEKVRKNIYDGQSVVIIPDDAKVISEEEYNKLLEEQKAKLQTK